MNLAECFDRRGCDKGTSRHRYHLAYEPVLEPLRNKPIRLLEIGILRGQSIAAWLDYFPMAEIVGLDTFERVPAADVEILGHPRARWRKCDSTQGPPDGIGEFDVIIDDGNHIQDAQIATFKGFMPLLKKDGVYFIEDVLPFDAKMPPDLFHRYPENTVAGHRRLMDTLKPYRVVEHDLRDSTHAASYMLEVRW